MSKQVNLCCVGTGDAFGSGGRFNSCFHLAVGDEQLLLDCGCSSLIGLQRCGLDLAAIDTVVISHLHGDHFGGLPFLLLEAKYVSCRQRPLTLIGPVGLQKQVEQALEILYPGTSCNDLAFPVIYRQLDPAIALQQGSFSISSCRVKHGRSKQVFGIKLEVAGKKIGYSGDTEWTDALIDLSAGSNLMIMECFAYSQSVPVHLDYQTLLKQQKKLNCERLVLTHMGPEMLAHIADVELEVLNDGDLIQL